MYAEPLKISSELRNIAFKCIDRARTAFEGFVEAAQTVASGTDQATVELHSDVKALGSKAIGYGEQNVKSALDLAQKLAESTSPQEAPGTSIRVFEGTDCSDAGAGKRPWLFAESNG